MCLLQLRPICWARAALAKRMQLLVVYMLHMGLKSQNLAVAAATLKIHGFGAPKVRGCPRGVAVPEVDFW